MIEEKSRKVGSEWIKRGRELPTNREAPLPFPMRTNVLQPKEDKITQVANNLAPKYGNPVLNQGRDKALAAKVLGQKLMNTPLRKWTPEMLQDAEELLGSEIIDRIRMTKK